MLKHHGVDVLFVSNGLDSRNPNFRTLMTILALQDEQASVAMSSAVHRGQKGAVLNGYHTGAPPYGYRSRLHSNAANGEEVSRSNVLGAELVIIPEKAAVVVRIYEMFAAGLSTYKIAATLDAEGVVAARKPRVGNLETAWNHTLVTSILRNPKYNGFNRWNRMKQHVDPETEKIEFRTKPEDQWVWKEVPEWRIVSPELSQKVQDRWAVIEESSKGRLAALSRSGKKEYLFSGLLFCGVCGGAIVITGGKGDEASYGCKVARYKRGCDNKIRIRADRFASAMIAALQEQVLTPDVLDWCAEVVHAALLRILEDERKANSKLESGDLQKAFKEQEAYVTNLLSLLRTLNPRDAEMLKVPVSEALERKRQIAKQIENVGKDQQVLPSLSEVREQVLSRASHFREILTSDVSFARTMLQQHINKIILIPTVGEDGRPLYEVLGDIDLFAKENRRLEVVMPAHSPTPNFWHYTETGYGYTGFKLDPHLDRPVAA